jgi:hypothetical protein
MDLITLDEKPEILETPEILELIEDFKTLNLKIKNSEIKNLEEKYLSIDKDGIIKEEIKEEIEETTLLTEDTGKVFEMAICLLYGIEYNGKYKYGLDRPNTLKNKLVKLLDLFPKCVHTASKGGRYDFTSENEPKMHLSAKTSKVKSGKVSPQVIGQVNPIKFCKILGIEYIDDRNVKKYIQENIIIILEKLIEYTLDCSNIYYNEKTKNIKYINLIKAIEWSNYEYKWTKTWLEWNNSSSLKIKINENFYSLVEFQFHSKSRKNMAIRWYYDTFLSIFKENLNIINI